MRHPFLLLALVIGLVAASVVAIALKPATLGLDLQGGVEVVLQGQPTEQSAVTDEAIDRSIEIIRGRVDAFGVAEPEIQKQGNDQIIVSLPGVDDPQTVVEDLIRPAQLLFFDFEDSLEGAEGGNPSLWDVVKLAQRTTPRNPDRGEPAFYAFDKTSHRLLEGPTVDEQSLKELFPNDTIPSNVTVQRVPRGLFIPYEERGLATRGD